MPDKTRNKKIYPAFFGQEFPADLALVVVWLAASIVVIYLPIQTITLVRIVLAFPVIFLIPGYCLIAALFPKEGDIGIIERIMLSMGCSIAIVALIGFGLNFTTWGIRLDPIIILLTVFTWAMLLVALYQRTLFPPEERFRLPFFAIVNRIRQEILPPEERSIDRLLSVVLAVVMLIAIIITGYVIASPKEGERFSEFYLLGEKQTAADYPDLIIREQNYPIYIGIGNHEFRDINYTIETWTMRTEFDNVTNTTSIKAMDPLDQMSVTLAHNETRIIPYTLLVKKNGYNRVELLLFNESVPGPEVAGSDRINASYRDLHLWVTIV